MEISKEGIEILFHFIRQFYTDSWQIKRWVLVTKNHRCHQQYNPNSTWSFKLIQISELYRKIWTRTTKFQLDWRGLDREFIEIITEWLGVDRCRIRESMRSLVFSMKCCALLIWSDFYVNLTLLNKKNSLKGSRTWTVEMEKRWSVNRWMETDLVTV